jgi:hypothetical protein
MCTTLTITKHPYLPLLLRVVSESSLQCAQNEIETIAAADLACT